MFDLEGMKKVVRHRNKYFQFIFFSLASGFYWLFCNNEPRQFFLPLPFLREYCFSIAGHKTRKNSTHIIFVMRQSGSFFHPMRENWRDARIESGAVYTWRHVNLLTELFPLWTNFDFSVRVWSFHQWQAHCWRSERKRTSSQRVSGSYQSGAWCLSYGRRNTGDVSLLFKMSCCILIVCVQYSSCFTQLEKKLTLFFSL